ncbi:MAG: hypothetical protein EXS16_04735 [Gemmataceae bacterium]|nr:hypothetical protein [Gemmataceae bacterium]
MAKRPTTNRDFDSPWKDALHFYLPAFILFFYPDIYADIDWTRPYEDLDKEFQKIARRVKFRKRYADKLFKVWLKDGTERWLLIHVEIQGDYDPDFQRRMFQYHLLAHQLYNHDVVSLAVLCDENENWRPERYGYENWRSGIEMTFRTAKLIDWLDKKTQLAESTNPFAAVVLAHLEAISARKDPAKLGQRKLELVKGLYRQNWSAEDVRRLFGLIDWVITLPEEFDEKFWADLNEYEEETKMEYVTSVERIGIRKGIAIGHEQGLHEGIGLILESKFGTEGARLLEKARGFNVSELRKFGQLVQKARTVDEVHAYLDNS